MKRQLPAMAYADEAYAGLDPDGFGEAYPSAKAQRLSSGPDAEDAWTCASCGNFNYGGRAVCNMRTCGAPKTLEAWTCPGCGNENHTNRPFCNMRSCGMAKPGLRSQDILAAAQHAKGGGLPGGAVAGVPLQMHVPMQVPARVPAMQGGAGAQPGSWSCGLCGNVNWPARTVCNGKNGTCGLPRPSAAAAAPHAPHVTQMQMPAAHQMPRAHQMPHMMPSPDGSNPPGSWQCVACGNMNWPTRTSCNGKKSGAVCGIPRSSNAPSVVMPAAMPAPMQQQGEIPEGSWVCSLCQNVNWPQRTSCNKRSCGAPRTFG